MKIKLLMWKLIRAINTLLVYVLFIIGALLNGLAVYFVLLLCTKSGIQRQGALRKSVSYSFRFFLWLCNFLCVFKVNFKNIKNFSAIDHAVIIANHPSLVDYVIIMSIMKNDTCVMVKESLTKTFMRFVIHNLGYFHNKSDINTVKKIIEDSPSVLIFPEGTRTKDYRNINFARGAANIALRNNFVIVPVFITCNVDDYLTYSFFSFKINDEIPVFTIDIGEPILLDCYLKECNSMAIAARHLTSNLQQMYQEYLDNARK